MLVLTLKQLNSSCLESNDIYWSHHQLQTKLIHGVNVILAKHRENVITKLCQNFQYRL